MLISQPCLLSMAIPVWVSLRVPRSTRRTRFTTTPMVPRPTTRATPSQTLTTHISPTLLPTRPPLSRTTPMPPTTLSWVASQSDPVAPCLTSCAGPWPGAAGPIDCRPRRLQTFSRLLLLDQPFSTS
ncbi:uncharacterized protein IWZ02DRAFT_441692 [Phyllosticta citriasiana]|uniref:uncharacterized protein n=1 Tax=Phyllosticta citriasiana TaxID=595635 RepID=UPI0030FDD75A